MIFKNLDHNIRIFEILMSKNKSAIIHLTKYSLLRQKQNLRLDYSGLFGFVDYD